MQDSVLTTPNTTFQSILTELMRYGAVSVIALLVDLGCLMALAQFFHYLLAASLSFVLGGIVAYQLSVRYVFSQRRIGKASTELTLFVTLGIAGLLVNAGIIAMSVHFWHIPLPLSKLLAAGATFSCNFVLRKWLLFTTTSAPATAPQTTT